jgi:hypothetical protein
MIGFRHCDPRWPFLWSLASQPAARWHGAGEGPANYFADTPVGAWAEFLRHEEIKDPDDLVGVRRSLWAVELPDEGYAAPALDESILKGGLDSYPICQNEARRLRSGGAKRLRTRAAALVSGGARGWVCRPDEETASAERTAQVMVVFGDVTTLIGWPAVEAGAPPPRILPLVRHF